MLWYVLHSTPLHSSSSLLFSGSTLHLTLLYSSLVHSSLHLKSYSSLVYSSLVVVESTPGKSCSTLLGSASISALYYSLTLPSLWARAIRGFVYRKSSQRVELPLMIYYTIDVLYIGYYCFLFISSLERSEETVQVELVWFESVSPSQKHIHTFQVVG